MTPTSPLPGDWTVVFRRPNNFKPETFDNVSAELVYHPERNTSRILRANVVKDIRNREELNSQPFSIKEFKVVRRVIRDLLPRNPDFDGITRQTCVWLQHQDEASYKDRILVILSDAQYSHEIPFYYPKVRGIAFHYSQVDDNQTITLSFLPFEEGISERILGVGRNLIETLCKHW
jgi:tRNASer (uridine44-2'-O)-methyltransferase